MSKELVLPGDNTTHSGKVISASSPRRREQIKKENINKTIRLLGPDGYSLFLCH